ncbi:MAG: gliding motility protein GldM [Cytophagales bacterium]
MAGGDSPRQKMINMMYIVLIAMLALNVDTKVLKKFIMINQSFEVTNSDKIIENNKKVESIRVAVDDSGNRREDVEVLNLSESIRDKSAFILTRMDDIKSTIVEETGGSDGKGGIKGYKNLDFVYSYMQPDGQNPGAGAELQDLLNQFSNFVQDSVFLGDENSGVTDLAKNADQIPLYQDDLPNDPSFTSLNFGFGTSAGAGLATISQLQADVINLEIKALDKLAATVGAADLKFDVVTLTTLPDQKVVAAGAKYKTQLFLSAASSAIVPTMTAGGDTLEVSNGRGYYEFTAKGGNYDREGLSKQSYVGAISVTLPGGKDTTFIDTVEYFVARPVIQIQSASVQALYFNCGNELTVNVPALGSEYNPTFSARGGDVVRGSKAGVVTIIPKSKKVDLNVSNAGNFIGSQSFGVRQIPAPEIKARIKGKEIDAKTGIPVSTPSFSLDAIADASFAEFLPKDARFQVREAEINLVRAGRGVSRQRVNNKNVNLTKLAGKRKGDNIVIEIKKVARANFRGDVEEFKNFAPRYITIPLK